MREKEADPGIILRGQLPYFFPNYNDTEMYSNSRLLVLSCIQEHTLDIKHKEIVYGNKR